MSRWPIAIVLVMVMGGVWASNCGGEILGYVDEAGVYHAPDGAVLFVPGSACVGFDASHVADPPPWCDNSPDAARDDGGDPVQCEGYPSVPPGFPYPVSGCGQEAADGAAHCIAQFRDALDQRCPSQDSQGDAYCQAWAQQFVVAGHAVATCEYDTLSMVLTCTLSQYSPGADCPFNTMAVTGTDAAPYLGSTDTACRFPCQP
jgi:hypothetical protein